MVTHDSRKLMLFSSIAMVLSIVTLLAAAVSFLSPCSIAHAQSGICSGAQTVTVAGGVTVNEDGGATATDDLRAETDSEANALLVDASANDVTLNVPLNVNDEINVGATPGPGSDRYQLVSQGADTSPEWEPTGAGKTADETISSSTVFQNDDHISFATEADTVYLVSGILRITFSSSADFKFIWNSGGTPTIDGFYYLEGAALPTAFTEAAGSGTTIATDGTEQLVRMYFTFEATEAGTLQLQWAQNTSQVTTCTVHEGSGFTITRVS